MTRLMSFWQQPTVAAKMQVAAPTQVTVCIAVGDTWNIGDRRQTMKTPAVTMVAAWMSALTGVGPSIASGSQVWSGSWADLPIAPTNSSRQSTVMVSARMPAKPMVEPAMPGAAARIAGIETVPNTRKVPKMPRLKPKSPMRLTTNAFSAAALAEGLWYQKPINRYEASPTPSQPKNICTRLSAVTSISIAKLNNDR